MRIQALVIRILRQFIHDKRSLALMIVAPMLILTLMSLVFNGKAYEPDIAVVDLPAAIVSKLQANDANILQYSASEADKALLNAEIDAIISIVDGRPSVKLEGSDPSANKAVILIMQKISQVLSPAAESIEPNITFLHGSQDMAAFDNFGPVLVGFFVFFFVFLVSGIAFLRERTGGTLERLLATPLRRWELVAGYLAGFGIFTMIQAALIAWFAINVLQMMMVGSFFFVLLVTLLMAMTALTIGTFLSAFANNEFQMIQFIPLIVVPQVFFSGLFNMDTMAEWLQWIGVVMPLTYGADALRDIMIRGGGWSDIAVDVYVLVGFSLFFIIANVLALRKHRKI